jgi:hypothetical protein
MTKSPSGSGRLHVATCYRPGEREREVYPVVAYVIVERGGRGSYFVIDMKVDRKGRTTTIPALTEAMALDHARNLGYTDVVRVNP